MEDRSVMLRRALALLAISIALSLPASAQAKPNFDQQGGKAFDAVVLRPLGFGKVVVGFAAFIPVAIVTSPGGRHSVSQAWKMFVRSPADAVFKRSLGDF